MMRFSQCGVFSVFQLPELSFQLLFWHLTSSSHHQSVWAVFVRLPLSFTVALSAGLEQTLFRSCSQTLMLTGFSAYHQCIRPAKREGALPFPMDLSLIADWVAKPELARWRRNHTVAHTVPSLRFPGSLTAKGSKHQCSLHFLRETAPGPKASIPDPNPFRGWC